MKKYNVYVNGTAYEVEIEEAGQSEQAPASRPASVQSAPAPKAAVPKPAAPKPQAAATGGNTITAPMPGTVLKMLVSAGDHINAGDKVAVLEAMKMENDIVAPTDLTVESVEVVEGASVNSGDLLISYAE